MKINDGHEFLSQVDGQRFAGLHLVLDMWGAKHLQDSLAIESALKDAAAVANATVLHGYFHEFSPHGGITGVLLLAESHISIHTWPEFGFAAVDLFMCGEFNPNEVVSLLSRWFEPVRLDVKTIHRGALGQRQRTEFDECHGQADGSALGGGSSGR